MSYTRPRESTSRRDERDPQGRRFAEPTRDRRSDRDTTSPRENPMDTRMDSRMETRVGNPMDMRMELRPDNRMETRMDTQMGSRMDTQMGTRMDTTRMDARMDPRMDARPGAEQRANMGRAVRTDARVSEAYRDVETGQVFDNLPPNMTRNMYPDDYDSMRPSTRPPALPQPDQLHKWYFVSGENIDREVLQNEICQYLGSNAISRQGVDANGQPGYHYRAYRAFTDEMIKSLQESTANVRAERDRRRRTGRPADGAHVDSQDPRYNYYDQSAEMDIDDRPSMMSRPPRDMDMRGDPRTATRDPRYGMIPAPTTTSYMPDPMYPSYMHTPGAPVHNSMHMMEPRTYPGNTGNTPPPPPGTVRAPPHAGYPQTGAYGQMYSTRPPSAAAPPMTSPPYRDSTADRMRDPYYSQGDRRR